MDLLQRWISDLSLENARVKGRLHFHSLHCRVVYLVLRLLTYQIPDVKLCRNLFLLFVEQLVFIHNVLSCLRFSFIAHTVVTREGNCINFGQVLAILFSHPPQHRIILVNRWLVVLVLIFIRIRDRITPLFSIVLFVELSQVIKRLRVEIHVIHRD